MRVGLVWQTPQEVSKRRQPSFCCSLSSTSAAAASTGIPATSTTAMTPFIGTLPFILAYLCEAAGSLVQFRGMARDCQRQQAQAKSVPSSTIHDSVEARL